MSDAGRQRIADRPGRVPAGPPCRHLSEPSRSDEDKRPGGVETLSRGGGRRRGGAAVASAGGRRVIAINYRLVISVMARVTVSERSGRRLGPPGWLVGWGCSHAGSLLVRRVECCLGDDSEWREVGTRHSSSAKDERRDVDG